MLEPRRTTDNVAGKFVLPPTATPKERLLMGLSGSVGLVGILTQIYWIAGLGIALMVLVVVVNQNREVAERQDSLDRLKGALPAMAPAEREEAVTRFCDRFRERTAQDEIKRYLATFGGEQGNEFAQ